MKKMIISLLLCILFTWTGCVIWLLAAAGVVAHWYYMLLIPIGMVSLITSCLFEEGRKEYKASRHVR